MFVVIALLALKIQSWLWRTYWRINYKLGTKVITIKNVSFISMLFFMTWIFQFIAQNITQISESYKCPAPFSLINRSIFIAPVRLIIVTLSITHKRDFLWPESCPIITPNSTQMSELIKCLARFSLIYRSIFIAPVRLIIVKLSIAHQQDFLWPESRPRLTQNFRTGMEK